MRRVWRATSADVAWLLFIAVAASAWALLFTLSLSHPTTPALGALSSQFDSEFWRALCVANPAVEPYARLVLMWAVMAAAMMAPTAAPAVSTLNQLTAGKPGAEGVFAGFLLGYLSAWLGFALAAAWLQQALAAEALLSPHGVSLSRELTAGLLLVAGLYQFSAFKQACLIRCRAPMAFFFGSWRPGAAGAWRMGLEHGLICIGCCWALMLLAFVGGAMNLAWMGVAMVLMFLEKTPAIGVWMTRPLGVVLVLAGLGVAAGGLG